MSELLISFLPNDIIPYAFGIFKYFIFSWFYNVCEKGYNSGINNFAYALINPIITVSENSFASGTIFSIDFLNNATLKSSNSFSLKTLLNSKKILPFCSNEIPCPRHNKLNDNGF